MKTENKFTAKLNNRYVKVKNFTHFVRCFMNIDNININQIGKIIIEPRYNFYVGLSKEFDRLQAGTKSMRQSIQLSIGYKIK